MKKQIQELILKYRIELTTLSIKRDTAEALHFHTECSAISKEMKQIDNKISDLASLINSK